MKYFNLKKEDVIKHLGSNQELGLNDKQIKEKKDQYGINEFTKKEEGSLWQDILDNLKEPMMLILLLAAFISGLIGEYYDSIGIICAITIGIGIGIITEGKSKKAADALSKLTENIEVKVLRNGKITTISKIDLVPGDIVYLEMGNLVPADGRILESVELKVREDMLTGESDDVSKTSDAVISMKKMIVDNKETIQDPIPADQINMLFGGTLVASGRGTMVVTSIGDATEMGKIAQNLGNDGRETPLQQKLGDLGSKIAKISSAIAGLLFIFMVTKMILQRTINIDTTGFLNFLESVDPIKSAFIVCVALIVAAVPEGLPTMINMTLAITMQKMAKINALVTKKEACETIGAVSVICSDKTGTLTQNRMTVEVVYVDGKFDYDFESNSFFKENCIINSTADIEIINGECKYLGSATECALLLHHKSIDYINERKHTKIIHQNQFSSKTKMMSTVIQNNKQNIFLAKGAPETILEMCDYIQDGENIVKIDASKREHLIKEITKLQVKSMRVLGFAYKVTPLAYEEVALTAENTLEVKSGLIFSGFVGIKDPLRPDVKDSVKLASNAGVTTKMLTGDNINTAKSIGEELGLLNNNMRVVESSYIDTLTDEQLKKEIKTISIVARSKPDTKMRIVQALQEIGEVVAVTGDGINDAPALNKADVGIAMGIAGTEVSKNASDIILTDDSFSTIVKGIKWGRGIYENFQRFIQFQITVNLVAFLVAIISQILGKEMPFTTIQLLWVNIIMDGPPALALGLEPVRDAVLERKPVNRKASIITKTMITSMILNALYITSVILVQLIFNPLGAERGPEGLFVPNEMETVLFALFAFSALFNALNCREFGTQSIFKNFFRNKVALKIILITAIAQIIFTEVFKGFFSAVSLSPIMWIKIILLSSTVIVVNEIVKFVLRIIKK